MNRNDSTEPTASHSEPDSTTARLADSTTADPDVGTDDNSWARPRPKATTRQKVVVALVGVACVSLVSFTIGVRVGKKRVPEPTTGFGRAGGFGGATGLATTGDVSTASTVSVPLTTTTIDSNLGGLLPGLEATPNTETATPDAETATPETETSPSDTGAEPADPAPAANAPTTLAPSGN